MAIIRKSEARALNDTEIEEKIRELEADLTKMRSQIRSGGAPENPGKINEIKRTIARLKTIYKEKSSK